MWKSCNLFQGSPIISHDFSFLFLSRLEDKWMNETGAHSLTFPPRTCLELILLLSLNNASLPHSLRFMNEWQVTNVY